jgi:hypothetical protein
MPRLRILALASCGLALAWGAAGCSHYELGTEGTLGFTTLYVEPMANKVLLPQAQAVMSTQLRDALGKDGRVSLVNSPEAADATLQTTIVSYHRDVAAVREIDTGLASKFSITLRVSCTLRDNRANRAFFENRIVEVQRDVFTDNGRPSSSAVGDQQQAEYNLMPILAAAMADKISHTVLDVW